MGKRFLRDFHDFIDDIPKSKLEGGICGPSIHQDVNFRLDMQTLTTARNGEPQKFNIQMQCNKHAKITSVAKLAPATVAMVLVVVDEPYTAAGIKAELHRTVEKWWKEYQEMKYGNEEDTNKEKKYEKQGKSNKSKK